MRHLEIPELLKDIIPVLRRQVLRHPDGVRYLTRTILWGVDSLDQHDPEVRHSCYVHEIHTPDSDRHLHNHPWSWAASLVLSGGYREIRCDGHVISQEWHRAGDLNILIPGDYHSVVDVLRDTYTLFLVGKEIQDWGFLVDGIHVPHGEYFRTHGSSMTHSEES